MFKVQTSKKVGIAVEIPKFEKIETKSDGGFTRIGQRVDVAVLKVLMDYELDGVKLKAGSRVLVPGDSGLRPWAKKHYAFGKTEFVLCPESDIIAFEVETYADTLDR